MSSLTPSKGEKLCVSRFNAAQFEILSARLSKRNLRTYSEDVVRIETFLQRKCSPEGLMEYLSSRMWEVGKLKMGGQLKISRIGVRGNPRDETESRPLNPSRKGGAN